MGKTIRIKTPLRIGPGPTEYTPNNRTIGDKKIQLHHSYNFVFSKY